MGRSSLSRRLGTVVINGASRVISSLSTSVISLVIIQTQSKEVWGSAVQWVLIFDLAFSVISWGSNPYLLREFSLDPKSISQQWSASLVARLPLVATFVLVLIVLPADPVLKVSMLVWALARYTYQLYEPLLLFNRNFGFSLTLEMTSLAVILTLLLVIDSQVTGEIVVTLIAAGMVWKSIVTSVWVFGVMKIARPILALGPPATAFLVASFPFLILTFSAMLQQRMDLYIVAYYLGDGDTAEYQIFINWLIFCQFLAALILNPFAKNIFRVSEAVLRKLERRFMKVGFFLSTLSILGVYVVIRLLYEFDLPPGHYALGYAYILVYYFYALRNYELGKKRKQTTVAVYSFVTSGVNLLLSLALTPSLGTTGALIAATLSQFFLLALYHLRKSAYAVG
jgi:O-antigen/teichoic acid export membrane protein